jgi:hypothetical protein
LKKLFFDLNTDYSFKIYNSTAQLPSNWNDLTVSTIFYPKIFRDSREVAPENMICHFIGLFNHETLVGVALSQF